MKNFILILLLFFISVFQSWGKPDNWQTSYFTISGKVINLSPTAGHRTIKFIFSDILKDRIPYSATLSKTDSFSFSIPSDYPQAFYIDYGSLTGYIAEPGGSLNIEIDARIWDDRSLKETYIKITGGSTATTNRLIQLFNQELPKEQYVHRNHSKAVKTKSPEEYASYIRQREQDYTAFARQFNKSHRTTPFFRHWQKDILKYQTFEDLMRFTWEYPSYHRDQKNFKFPDSWYDFLKQYNPNDQRIFSWNHQDFMSEYQKYIYQKQSGSVNRPSNLTEHLLQTKTNILENSRRFSRQVLLGRFYLALLESKELQLFETLYAAKEFTIPYFSNTVKQEHEKLKQFITKQNYTSLSSFSTELLDGLLDTLANKYKNKVIYIDFWATWCGPCLAEMPYSHKLQQHFTSNSDIIFLYLASQCSAESWKATIAERKLEGEHLLLTEDQFNLLSEKLGINGIPHYTLINKKGEIVLKDAPRPSSAQTIKEIEKWLK